MSVSLGMTSSSSPRCNVNRGSVRVPRQGIYCIEKFVVHMFDSIGKAVKGL